MLKRPCETKKELEHDELPFSSHLRRLAGARQWSSLMAAERFLNTDRWHIDKGINIGVIIVLLAQFAWFWTRDGVREKTLSEHERRIESVEQQRTAERLATLEAQQAELRSQNAEIKSLVLRVDSKVDRISDKLNSR